MYSIIRFHYFSYFKLTQFLSITRHQCYLKHNTVNQLFICGDNLVLNFQQTGSLQLMFKIKPYPDPCCYDTHMTRTGLQLEIFFDDDKALSNFAKISHT